MSGPGAPPPYYPPTSSAPQPPPPPGYAPAPGYAPPPGYAIAVPRARPQQLGIAAGCTIAVGVLALVAGLVLLLVAFFLTGLFETFVPGMMGWLTGSLAFIAVIPIAYGAVTVGAGAGLNSGSAGAWTAAVVVNVLSVLFALPSVMAMGFGLLHGALSGVALWALFQPDVKAYCGH